jgi:hypothetical protein
MSRWKLISLYPNGREFWWGTVLGRRCEGINNADARFRLERGDEIVMGAERHENALPTPRKPSRLLIAPTKFREAGRNASRSLPVREIQDSKRVAIIPASSAPRRCG